MTPQDAYFRYLALKLHFTSTDYDFFQYRGKVSATDESFAARPDKRQFERVCRNLNIEDFTDGIMAHLISERELPLPHQFADLSHKYEEWREFRLDPMAHFRGQMRVLSSRHKGSLDTLLKMNVRESQPLLFKYYVMKLITPQTMIMMHRALLYFEDWTETMKDHPLWPKTTLFFRKLQPFVLVDTDEVEQSILFSFSS